MFKDASVSDLDKQWSSIESKFKSIADESGKINLSKQKKDIQELVEMYQKYSNAGGMKTPFDLTDNTETIKKINKVYEQMNSKKDGTSVTNESKNFIKVEDSVNSLTSAINTKTEAIKTESNTMELAASSEIKSIQKIIDALNPLIEKIENIPELKIPKEGTTFPSKESNISSGMKDAFPNTDTKLDETVTSAKDLDKTLKQVDIPTDSFDKVLEKLDRTKSELVDIVKITKQSISDKDGKFHDSYTLKDSRGSTEIYGINSKTDKGQILRQNIVGYDVKKDTSNNSKAQAHSAKEEWINALKTVKEYETAVSKLNNLKASDKGLGIKSNEIVEQEKKIDDMKSSFDAAQTTIISFLSSIDKFNTLPVSSIQEVSNAIKLIQTASKGSAESVAKLEDALRNVEKVNLDNFEKEKNQKINKLSSYADGTKYTSEFKSRVSDEIAKIQKLQFSNPNDVTILKQIDNEIQEIINDSKLLENKLVKQESHLAGIGEKWQDLNDIDRASLLESLAGKNQSNALAAALSQVDLLKKAYGEATNAEGSAREENSKYQQSVQHSIDQTKAKLEELANDTLNSNFLKGAIDAGGKLIEVLDGIVKSGNAIPTLLATIGAGLSLKNIGKCYVSA